MKDNKLVVLKSVIFPANCNENEKNLGLLFCREILITKKLKNFKKIVRYVDDFRENDRIYLITEFCDSGNLNEYILNKNKKNEKISEKEAIKILIDILAIIKGLFNNSFINFLNIK